MEISTATVIVFTKDKFIDDYFELQRILNQNQTLSIMKK